jgi:hypothetical protein
MGVLMESIEGLLSSHEIVPETSAGIMAVILVMIVIEHAAPMQRTRFTRGIVREERCIIRAVSDLSQRYATSGCAGRENLKNNRRI